jgi:hypothetical protein
LVQTAGLNGIATGRDTEVVDVIFEAYASWSKPVKRSAVAVLLSRPAWAVALLNRIDFIFCQ